MINKLALLLLGVLLLASCGDSDKSAEEKTAGDSVIGTMVSGERGTAEKVLKIGVMPDAGALPLLLMDDMVEPVPFLSARERDTALLLGELDGIMGDLVGVVSNTLKGNRIKVASVTESRFMIVGTPAFSEEDAWEVGLSENTVIEYMVDELSEDENIVKVSIAQVPVRMEMLANGKIPLACLTDAMAWPLLSTGFQIVRDQQGSGLEPAILAFSEAASQDAERWFPLFAETWNAAVERINSDPESYRDLLREQVRLPATEEPYPIPVFRPITLPSEAAVESVLSWYAKRYPEENVDLEYGELMLPAALALGP